MKKLKCLKLLDSYILQLVAVATFVGIVAFVVVWISPETLFKIINRVSYGQITLQQGMEWFFFEIPTILGKAIPVGLLLGTLFITDMLSRNFELVVLRAFGVSFWRLLRPILILSSVFAIFCFFAYNTFIPYSSQRVQNIKAGKVRPEIQWSYLEKDEQSNPKQLIIISKTNGDYMENINVFQISPDVVGAQAKDVSMKNIIFAKNGQFKDEKFIINDVTVYELLDTGIYKDIIHKDEMTILQGKTATNAYKLLQMYNVDADELTQKELKEYLQLLKDEQIKDEYNANLNNLYQRFAQTLSCIIFAICGLILGWSRPRENRFLGFTIGALIIFSYYLTVPFINMLAEKSILPPIITAFLPLVIISVGMFFYARSKDL